MESKKDYLFKKVVDWVFRRKTIIYFLVMALLREFIALGAGETIAKWEIDDNLQNWYIHYPIMGLNFIFSGGDWNVIYILVFLIVLFRVFELFESYINSKKGLESRDGNKSFDKDISIKAKKIKKVVNIDNVEGDVHL